MSSRKQNFLQGIGVLGICLVIVKIINAIYKIPLNNIIGAEGYTYFLQAYDIYALLLVVSTAGLPTAMSRMVAESQAAGNRAQLNQIMRASTLVFTVLGVAGTLIMMVFAKPLAILMGIPDGVPIFLALGPAVLFVCLSSAYRGWFQGQSMMTPSGVSQVVESVCKPVIGLSLAWAVMKMTGNLVTSVAGAILGVTVGVIIATVYLFFEYHRAASSLEGGDPSLQASSLGNTVKELLSIGIPITIGSAGLQIFSLIDSAMLMHQLQNAAGFAYEEAKTLRGLYGTAQTIFCLPGTLLTAFTATLIPSVSACVAKKNWTEARDVASSELRVMCLFIMPSAVGMCVLGEPIIRLLYTAYSDEEAAMTGLLLSILAVSVILNALTLLLNSILQAHHYVYVPLVNMLAGGLVKVVVNYFLVGIPSVNIYGAPVGTTLCFLVITVMDVVCMKRLVPEAPKLMRLIWKSLVISLLMGAVTYACYRLLSGLLGVRLACVSAICIAIVFYAAEVLLFRLIDYSDCLLLPKGDKIARLLRLRPQKSGRS